MIIQNFFKAVNNGGEMQPYFGRVFEKNADCTEKKTILCTNIENKMLHFAEFHV